MSNGRQLFPAITEAAVASVIAEDAPQLTQQPSAFSFSAI
jgi:hypothetical protein